MSSALHAVVRSPSFTGLGNLPDLTPAHQVERLTGIIGGLLSLPKICGRRKKPVSGIVLSCICLTLSVKNKARICCAIGERKTVCRQRSGKINRPIENRHLESQDSLL